MLKKERSDGASLDDAYVIFKMKAMENHFKKKKKEQIPLIEGKSLCGFGFGLGSSCLYTCSSLFSSFRPLFHPSQTSDAFPDVTNHRGTI